MKIVATRDFLDFLVDLIDRVGNAGEISRSQEEVFMRDTDILHNSGLPYDAYIALRLMIHATRQVRM